MPTTIQLDNAFSLRVVSQNERYPIQFMTFPRQDLVDSAWRGLIFQRCISINVQKSFHVASRINRDPNHKPLCLFHPMMSDHVHVCPTSSLAK